MEIADSDIFALLAGHPAEERARLMQDAAAAGARLLHHSAAMRPETGTTEVEQIQEQLRQLRETLDRLEEVRKELDQIQAFVQNMRELVQQTQTMEKAVLAVTEWAMEAHPVE